MPSPSAAMLADIPAGGSPAGATRPVGTVVISGGGKGDRPVESPEVKVSVGWVEQSRSDPPGRQATRQAVAMRTEVAPKCEAHLKRMVGELGSAESLGEDEGQRRRRRNWAQAADALPGVVEDGMPRGNDQRKHGTTRRLEASRISRRAVKSRCVGEWGGWGRLSGDGPGQHNPDRSEGPWGKAARAARTAALEPAHRPDSVRGARWRHSECEGRRQTAGCDEIAPRGKAPPETPALKPYRGKPAVQNFRGDDGNVGDVAAPRHCPTRPDSDRGEVRITLWTPWPPESTREG